MFKNKKVFVYIICVIFAVSANFCHSQITCISGENVRHEITNWISHSEKIQVLFFTVKSSNPTVFYIDSIKINDLIAVDLDRNYWEIKCFVSDLKLESIDLIIYGTGLNSADTITLLQITDIIFDGNTAEDTIITAISKNNNNHKIIKFAKILKVYPVPLRDDEDLNIDFLIDVPQNISFTVADAMGKIIGKYEIKNANVGNQTFSIKSFGNSISSGMYYIFLETNAGNASKLFIKAQP